MLLAALLAVSCMNFGTGSQNTYQFVCTYDSGTQTDELFGEDSVFFFDSGTLYFGPVCHYAKMKAGSHIPEGGFALSKGCDTLVAEGHVASRYAVCGTSGSERSKAFLVWKDTLSTLMPEHAVTVTYPNNTSSGDLLWMDVNNTAAVVNAALYGTGLEGGPFTGSDYLTLKVRTLLSGKQVYEKEIKRVDGTKPIREWTLVDLSEAGQFDTMDLSMSSSRPDMPLYCCLDNFTIYYREIYE